MKKKIDKQTKEREAKIISQIKSVKWKYLVNRKEALLCHSLTNLAYLHFKKHTGIDWKVSYRMHSSDGYLFHAKNQLEDLRLIFKQGGYKLLNKFSRIIENNVTKFDQYARRLRSKDFSKLNQKQLLKYVSEFFRKAGYAHSSLGPMPVADKVLSSFIIDSLPSDSVEQKQRWLQILVFPEQDNYYLKEERSFLRLVDAYLRKDKSFDKLLQDHLAKFTWIGARWYWFDNAWQKKDLMLRLGNFIKQKKNPLAELSHLRSLKKERIKQADELMKELKIRSGSSLYRMIKLARRYAYLRTWRTDIIYRSGFYARHLFYEIARRAGFPQSDIVYLTWEEVLQMTSTLVTPISLAELKRRRQYYILLWAVDKPVVLSGSKWKEIISSLIAEGEKKEIRGMIAFSGKVIGRVRKVLTVADINKVKKGDILVAVMTFPHFIAAMEKASAFVTDEGGILCHAAIVAREMKKPCIIGTKNATQMLKDGDLVEVDADRGVVRLL